MAFRKFGGLEYTKSNNYVSSNTTNNMKLSITDTLGKLNTKIVVDSHMDLNNQSMFNVGDIYFSNGTSIINGQIDITSGNNDWLGKNTFEQQIFAKKGINAYYTSNVWDNTALSYFSNATINISTINKLGCGDLDVTGTSTFSGTTTFTGDTTFDGDLTLNTITVTGIDLTNGSLTSNITLGSSGRVTFDGAGLNIVNGGDGGQISPLNGLTFTVIDSPCQINCGKLNCTELSTGNGSSFGESNLGTISCNSINTNGYSVTCSSVTATGDVGCSTVTASGDVGCGKVILINSSQQSTIDLSGMNLNIKPPTGGSAYIQSSLTLSGDGILNCSSISASGDVGCNSVTASGKVNVGNTDLTSFTGNGYINVLSINSNNGGLLCGTISSIGSLNFVNSGDISDTLTTLSANEYYLSITKAGGRGALKCGALYDDTGSGSNGQVLTSTGDSWQWGDISSSGVTSVTGNTGIVVTPTTGNVVVSTNLTTIDNTWSGVNTFSNLQQSYKNVLNVPITFHGMTLCNNVQDGADECDMYSKSRLWIYLWFEYLL